MVPQSSFPYETKLPPLSLEEWRPTKETLHRYAQIVGKVRLEHSPYANHWWHVPLHVSPRGRVARHMFSSDLPFEVTFDLVAHELEVVTGAGGRASFALKDGLSVTGFYADLLTREGYSHEVISFGFWPGDANAPEPTFYSYTAPAPEGLMQQTLSPASASWQGGSALLPYEEVRKSDSPKNTLLEFLEGAYRAGAKTANWDVDDLETRPAVKR